MQKKGIRILLWVLTLAMCVVIFAFSEQNGEDSMETSGRIAEPIARQIASTRPRITPSQYRVLLNNVQHYVRKTAHFTEYAVLGALVCLLAVSYARRFPVLFGVLFGALYAAGDEVHQLIGGSRTGMWEDVLLDATGALTGAAAAWLVARLVRKRRGGESRDGEKAEQGRGQH